MSTHPTPVDRIIATLGGLTKTARALEIDNPSVVANWRKRGRVPSDRVLAASDASGIPPHEIRPDLYRDATFSAHSSPAIAHSGEDDGARP